MQLKKTTKKKTTKNKKQKKKKQNKKTKKKKKKRKCHWKNFDIWNISAKNIDCGYTLELPRRGGSNEYPQYNLCFRSKIRRKKEKKTT